MRNPVFLLATVVLAQPVFAQEMPADYAAVLKTLGRQGDFKDGVLKVNIPRNDISVSIDGVATPTPFGFGGWIAFAKGHMTTTEPTVYFLQYWGRGPAQKLATGIRAAVDQTGTATSTGQ